MKNYSKYFNKERFWEVITVNGKVIPFLRNAVAMYYCLQDPETPIWVKALIIGALGYFVFPFDAVPDAIPVAGWLDDAGVISGVLTVIHMYITDTHWQKAGIVLKNMGISGN